MMAADKAPSVIALAGRRVDRGKSSSSRFPEARVPAVRLEIAKLLTQEHAVAIVSSAACGADLIGLEEAERLGIRRRIVLPFTQERFRTKSVSDCPGNWLSSFDRIIAMGSATEDLVVLDQSLADSRHAFAAANERIILEARQVGSALFLNVPP